MTLLPDRLPTYACDVVGLVSIALVLAGIQSYVPLSVRDALVFDHGQLRGYTLLTAAYVHASEPHLLQNLDGYVRIVGFPYLYSVASDGRRWFWQTTLALLFVLPILTSLTSYALLPVLYPDVTPVTYGFSDVVAGFAGVLIVAVGRYVQARHSPTVAWAVSCTGGALAVAVIGIRLTGTASAAVTGTVGLRAGLVVAGGWFLTAARSQSDARTRLAWVTETVVFGLTGVVFGTLLWDFFPPLSALATTGPTTNLVGHAAGLGWGVVLAVSLHGFDRNEAVDR
ncbi:hypothetical protein [Halobellus ordinarius]|uniref:hypothetical protein n=1 Tax=Halobellus ordinarius TaxID=3075120 RepID=UPI002880A313|nr:hypothetical protein [Halobellus sp. ZY16]